MKFASLLTPAGLSVYRKNPCVTIVQPKSSLWLSTGVCNKFKDYLLGSKFTTIFTDNNPFCYIKSNKLGAAQIHWLSELTLYNFDIVYHTRRSNLVMDVLSCRLEVNKEVKKEAIPESNEECITVSYQVEDQGGCISSAKFNQAISKLVGGTKIDKKLRQNSCHGHRDRKTRRKNH